jgi:hypothetical protein
MSQNEGSSIILTNNHIVSLQDLEVAKRTDIYVIDKIKGSRKLSTTGSLEYLVAWRGYPNEDTWEPVENIEGQGDWAIGAFLKTRQKGK